MAKMKLTELQTICEKQVAGEGCKKCPAKDFCLQLKRVSELSNMLHFKMPLMWQYEELNGAFELQKIIGTLFDFRDSGKWIRVHGDKFQCDNKTCGYTTKRTFMFCPCCGNRMEGAEE